MHLQGDIEEGGMESARVKPKNLQGDDLLMPTYDSAGSNKIVPLLEEWGGGYAILPSALSTSGRQRVERTCEPTPPSSSPVCRESRRREREDPQASCRLL